MIFLKDGHFTTAYYNNKAKEIVYFDPYGEESRF
jgi:hypothetical protein